MVRGRETGAAGRKANWGGETGAMNSRDGYAPKRKEALGRMGKTNWNKRGRGKRTNSNDQGKKIRIGGGFTGEPRLHILTEGKNLDSIKGKIKKKRGIQNDKGEEEGGGGLLGRKQHVY